MWKHRKRSWWKHIDGHAKLRLSLINKQEKKTQSRRHGQQGKSQQEIKQYQFMRAKMHLVSKIKKILNHKMAQKINNVCNKLKCYTINNWHKLLCLVRGARRRTIRMTGSSVAHDISSQPSAYDLSCCNYLDYTTAPAVGRHSSSSRRSCRPKKGERLMMIKAYKIYIIIKVLYWNWTKSSSHKATNINCRTLEYRHGNYFSIRKQTYIKR